jgi:hypothetical protein
MRERYQLMTGDWAAVGLYCSCQNGVKQQFCWYIECWGCRGAQMVGRMALTA